MGVSQSSSSHASVQSPNPVITHTSAASSEESCPICGEAYQKADGRAGDGDSVRTVTSCCSQAICKGCHKICIDSQGKCPYCRKQHAASGRIARTRVERDETDDTNPFVYMRLSSMDMDFDSPPPSPPPRTVHRQVPRRCSYRYAVEFPALRSSVSTPSSSVSTPSSSAWLRPPTLPPPHMIPPLTTRTPIRRPAKGPGELYNTRMCRYHVRCNFGRDCHFAHSGAELRSVADNRVYIEAGRAVPRVVCRSFVIQNRS
ncbi:unnamed protein product [Vitrella brassicaformis CCMP3155]|uniref:Uncharacterized protein n=2 Tax=Vitrella brassicaformis TaxID=1169539 RepID=A0A0G4FDM3_VITBC|nr:unnamed protein product [Vitrella brassicaformis CCMP3155]|mmetsp:Transcript_27898/g.69663  ORF Transcript_27898/g.69663 Transcript_27898/m.69663 type:complete len:258 (+) Transcript_27898:134-907(+)|eukprot:CEM11290.1 unnamed protein product [Vitrella brassicaformis CCMP3155]